MAKETPILTNFTSGELSPLLDGRVDVAKYYNGAKTLENYIPLPYGGTIRRPGTYFVAEVKDSTKAVRLVSFQFSTTQSYILEFGDLYIRFYMDNGQILSGGVPYEIATPYIEADLFNLQFAQDADTMWIVHPSYKPRKLTRTGHTNWTLANYAPAADPFGADASDDCPSCVTIHEQRIWFANSNNDPQKLWGSVSGDYEDMTTGINDSDALEYTIGSEQVNAIRWLSSSSVLAAGTLGGVFSIDGESGAAITPTNVRVRRETTFGSINIVPKKIGNYIYYVQRNDKIVREFAYYDAIAEYRAEDATILSEHITGDGIVDMDYQQSPYNILWCVREDGEIAVLTRQISQEVLAWARITTDGEFESVAVIPGDSDDDEVWVIVKRLNSTKRYVEYFKPFDFGSEQEDAFHVDSGLTQDSPVAITNITQALPGVVTAAGHGLLNGDICIIRGVTGMTEVNQTKYKVAGVAGNDFSLTNKDTGDNIDTSGYTAYSSGGEVRKCTTTLGALTHLNGKEVQLLVDGSVSTAQTVAAGSITLDAATGEGGEIHAGLQYISTIKTMRIEAGSALGTAQSKKKRIQKIVVRLHESLGLKAGDEDTQRAMPFRTTGDTTDAPIPLFSGDKEVWFPSSYSKDAYVVLKQEDPLPSIILAIIIYLSTFEG